MMDLGGAFPGFGGLWGLVGMLFPVMFLLIFGVGLFSAVQGLRTWNRNNRAPRLEVAATVVSRRTEVSRHTHHHGDGHVHHAASTRYYATFQVSSGDRMEFSVPGREYGLLAEGDAGTLTFQGSRYLSFLRG